MARIALIGCGLWGKNILRILLELDATVDVVDVDRRRREEAMAQGATAAFDCFDGRSAADGIIIATPATTHADVTTELLPVGKPIFVEKPFTTDVASAEKLAETGKGKVFVMDIWRYHPGIQVLAEIVKSDELGPVELLRSTRTNWTSPRKDTDAIWTLLPHDLAIALEIFGHIPAPEFARAEYRDGKVAGALVSLGPRPSTVIELSTRYADKRREVRIHCRDGIAVLNAIGRPEIEIYRETNGAPAGSTSKKFERREPLEIELEAFLDHLAGGPPPKSSAEDGAKIVRVIEQIRALAGIGA